MKKTQKICIPKLAPTWGSDVWSSCEATAKPAKKDKPKSPWNSWDPPKDGSLILGYWCDEYPECRQWKGRQKDKNGFTHAAGWWLDNTYRIGDPKRWMAVPK